MTQSEFRRAFLPQRNPGFYCWLAAFRNYLLGSPAMKKSRVTKCYVVNILIFTRFRFSSGNFLRESGIFKRTGAVQDFLRWNHYHWNFSYCIRRINVASLYDHHKMFIEKVSPYIYVFSLSRQAR